MSSKIYLFNSIWLHKMALAVLKALPIWNEVIFRSCQIYNAKTSGGSMSNHGFHTLPTTLTQPKGIDILVDNNKTYCQHTQINTCKILNTAIISENPRKLYVANLANDVHCNFPPEALMNTVSSYEAAYWLERISYNFLIWERLLCFSNK